MLGEIEQVLLPVLIAQLVPRIEGISAVLVATMPT
jgi:hypothetical protein